MRTLRIILILLAVAIITSLAVDADAGQGKGGKPAACAKGWFPATGQTTSYTADKNAVPSAAVPEDGTVQAGIPLRYQDKGDGTIQDLNTGLIWKKKSNDGGLHDMANSYYWSAINFDTI